jgi:hypothetical protein
MDEYNAMCNYTLYDKLLILNPSDMFNPSVKHV